MLVGYLLGASPQGLLGNKQLNVQLHKFTYCFLRRHDNILSLTFNWDRLNHHTSKMTIRCWITIISLPPMSYLTSVQFLLSRVKEVRQCITCRLHCLNPWWPNITIILLQSLQEKSKILVPRGWWLLQLNLSHFTNHDTNTSKERKRLSFCFNIPEIELNSQNHPTKHNLKL